jgi:hypothetical protein
MGSVWKVDMTMIDLLSPTHIVNPFTDQTEVGDFEAIRRLTS